MPDLPLMKIKGGQALATATKVIWSVMLYPNSQRHQQVAHAAMLAQDEAVAAMEGNSANPWLGLLGSPNLAPPVESQKQAGKEAGRLLWTILGCARYHQGWAGPASAQELLRQAHVEANREFGTKLNVSPKALGLSWAAMRAAAHLWAAWESPLHRGWDWSNPTHVKGFLALAEALRQAGEQHHAPLGRLPANGPVKSRSKRPLLDPDNSWRVPQSVELPPLSLLLRPLPAESFTHLCQKKGFAE